MSLESVLFCVFLFWILTGTWMGLRAADSIFPVLYLVGGMLLLLLAGLAMLFIHERNLFYLGIGALALIVFRIWRWFKREAMIEAAFLRDYPVFQSAPTGLVVTDDSLKHELFLAQTTNGVQIGILYEEFDGDHSRVHHRTTWDESYISEEEAIRTLMTRLHQKFMAPQTEDKDTAMLDWQKEFDSAKNRLIRQKKIEQHWQQR